jgi:FADH2 O2-dependent halogenase
MAHLNSSADRPDADVVILGSGIAGSTLAAVLARNGASVLMIDAGSHPRFAVGESTTPHTSMLLRLISERYDVPEIKHLTTFENVQSNIARSCGVKRNFGFLYHRPRKRQLFGEAHQFPISRILHTESHLFRQDTDAWMMHVAVGYGARIKQHTAIADIAFDDDGVTLADARGTSFRGRFVVDATGQGSPLAAQLGLREDPPSLRHHARSLFTHMIDVAPYEDIVPRVAHGNPTKWSEGTLHHIFEGGWLWVIPFNNHLRGTNPLVSVGLCLDPRVHPPADAGPEEEFRAFIDRFPDIRRQFAGARAIRPWVSTPRMQYSSHTTVGPRWCLASHAAGFIDPLFSRGLSNSFEIVNALGSRLLDALRDDDFSVERFEYVQRLEAGLLRFNDEIVANAYTSFRDYELWDAWFRVWALAQIFATFEVNRVYARYLDTHDAAELEPLERVAPDGSLPRFAPARELHTSASADVRAVADGRLDARTAAQSIMRRLQEADFIPPAFGLDDPSNTWLNATPAKALRAIRWARNGAPPEIGSLVDEGLSTFIHKRLSRDEFQLGEELKHAMARWPVVGRRLRTSPVA